MKTKIIIIGMMMLSFCLTAQDLIITGVIDGPLTGGKPKAIEFYVQKDIADLSVYGFGSANNGGGSDGQEFTFSGSASKDVFLFVSFETTDFENWFGFSPSFTSSAAQINGDDAIELFHNGVVIDVFGDINTDGTGEQWDYMDGWAYRTDFSLQDGSSFDISHWSFSGINALDGEISNSTASSSFPIASYHPPFAKHNGIGYETIALAVDAASAGETVVVLEDVSAAVDEVSIIPMGVTLSISNVSYNATDMTNNGTIDITSGGTFTNTGTYKGSGNFIGNFVNNGTLSPGN